MTDVGEESGGTNGHLNWYQRRRGDSGVLIERLPKVANVGATMPPLWPKVRDSEEIVPWGIEELRDRALAYELFHHAGRTSTPDLNEPERRAGFEYYLGAELEGSDTQHLAENYAHLAGQSGRHWTMDDFKLPQSDYLKRSCISKKPLTSPLNSS